MELGSPKNSCVFLVCRKVSEPQTASHGEPWHPHFKAIQRTGLFQEVPKEDTATMGSVLLVLSNLSRCMLSGSLPKALGQEGKEEQGSAQTGSWLRRGRQHLGSPDCPWSPGEVGLH